MIIKKVYNADHLSTSWDLAATSVYQKRTFLSHLEKTNFSNQRYYSLYKNELFCAGAVVYTLKINLLTFSQLKLPLSMQVIGLPVSNDQSGLLGNADSVNALVSEIIEQESGIVLCLNHSQDITIKTLIHMQSLPSMIYEVRHNDWESYMNALRHPYRRRIKKAMTKIKAVRTSTTSCEFFTADHYHQYLEVLKRSKTKLEVMDKKFFELLPEGFKLKSYYDGDSLLFWNITTCDNDMCHFLFGGLNYSVRDHYDSYANNLIDIIKEGIKNGCKQISLGQTAEISKSRFGAIVEPKNMFLYHRNKIIRFIFRMMRRLLSHTKFIRTHKVYKKTLVTKKVITKNQLMEYNYAEFK
ncbi:hypothetical protein U0L90_13395 [Flavobacteriaceae sp. LMIT009]